MRLLPSTALAREGFHTNTSAPHLALTYEIPGHLLVLLHAAHVAELQEGVHVVGVHLEQQLQRALQRFCVITSVSGTWSLTQVLSSTVLCDTQCQELP